MMPLVRRRTAEVRKALVVGLATVLTVSCSGPIKDLVGGPSTPEGHPDLAVSWLHTNPPEIGPSALGVDVAFLVTNIGEVPAGATTTRVAFEVETEPGTRVTIAAEDVYTPPIDRGGTFYITQSLSWNDRLPFGEHRIVVTLDALLELEQSDTSNDRAEMLIGLEHPCTDPNVRVVFADPQLESLVASNLGLPTDVVSCDALQELHELWVSYLPITSLDGLQFASRLEAVYLSDSAVTDLSPLEALPSLRTLDVSNMPLSALEGLESLERLESLYASAVGLTDLSPLVALGRLMHLDVSHNDLTDLEPLGQLPSLQRLNLRGNPLQNLAPLESLPKLYQLEMAGLPVTDWSFLSQLHELRWLYLGDHPSFDSALLSSLPPRLSHLWITQQALDSLAFVAQAPSLRGVELTGTGLTDVSELAAAVRLRQVRLGDNAITDVSFVADLPELFDLDLSSNMITDISALADNLQFGEGAFVYLSDNCLDLSVGAPAQLVVAELESRGAQVWTDPQRDCR